MNTGHGDGLAAASAGSDREREQRPLKLVVRRPPWPPTDTSLGA